MQHLALKATTTTTDQELGTFTALVSAWTSDRERDTISRTAFDKTIAAWQGSGKRLPLLFEHSTTVVGAVDPQSMRPTEAGLVVAGEVDRESEEGQQAWPSIKANTAGFSIGFMAESSPRKGGGRELKVIDLLEVSITSQSMHPSTRALSWKSAGDFDYEAVRQQSYEAMMNVTLTEEKRSLEELRADLDATLKSAGIDLRPPPQIKTFPVE